MFSRLLFALAALPLSPECAFAQSQDIPPALAVQQGATLLGKYAAQGVQIYICRAKGATNEWAFKAPEAKLVDAEGKPFAKHYAGPSWEAPDGSKAVGKVLANETAPKAGRNSVAALVCGILALGLTPEQYREKWKLPSDYPMVAPNYRHSGPP